MKSSFVRGGFIWRIRSIAEFMNSWQERFRIGDVIRGFSAMAGSAWYDVIALATSKGGVGKSTLARGLAAHWFALGRKPALIDADPTATLSKRYNPRGPLGPVPALA